MTDTTHMAWTCKAEEEFVFPFLLGEAIEALAETRKWNIQIQIFFLHHIDFSIMNIQL